MNTFSSSSPVFDFETVAFFGRSFDEYLRFFNFTPSDFAGRTVLDVAAGPSSFTAEARARGVEAVAVDPLYGFPCASLTAHVDLDYRRMFARMRDQPERFRFHAFASFDAAERDRAAAARRFLTDYEAHFAHDRYVGASLPALPFASGAFDFVLCAHLLFIYAHRFDYAFHFAACRELVRVARSEVRIHPLCGADGRPYPEFDRLRKDLDAGGFESEVREVDYEFFTGSGSTLVLQVKTPPLPIGRSGSVGAGVSAAPG